MTDLPRPEQAPSEISAMIDLTDQLLKIARKISPVAALLLLLARHELISVSIKNSKLIF